MKCEQGLRSGTMINAIAATSRISSEQTNILPYKFLRVEKDGYFISASEDEVTEVQHLLLEPKNENGLMDGFLSFDASIPDKNMEAEGFQCLGDYSPIISGCGNGGIYSSTVREGNVELNYGFLDGMLQGVVEGDFHVAGGLSSVCDDYLLDNEFSERVSLDDYGPCEGTHPGNLGGDSNSPSLSEGDKDGSSGGSHPRNGGDNDSPSLSEGDRGVVGISKCLTATSMLPDLSCDQNSVSLEKLTMRELQLVFRNTFGRGTNVKDKPWLKRQIKFGMKKLVELENVPVCLESGISSNESEGNMTFTSDDSAGRIQSSFANISSKNTKLDDHGLQRDRFSRTVGATTSSSRTGIVRSEPMKTEDQSELLRKKRQRNPTRRYIEELSNGKLRSCGGRLESPITNSRDNFRRPRSRNCNNRKGLGETAVVYRQDSLRGPVSGIPVPFGLQVRRGRPKKNTSILGHCPEDDNDDSVFSPNESEDDMSDDSITRTWSGKGGTQRKLHKTWSLSEVMKLVDGVSKFGVGRWTEIKRQLFSTSAHRTSVDLKDKWRNLLRASGAGLCNKRKVDRGQKYAVRPIPPSVLRRVSELAVIHPYPRPRKSKLALAASALTPKAEPPPTLLLPSYPNISRRRRTTYTGRKHLDI